MQVLAEKEAEEFLEKKGFPVALKIVSKKIIHKSDVNGVKLNIKNNEELKQAFNELKQIKFFEGAVVQKYIEGKYILAGLKNDPTFGPVLVFGLGGIYTE